MGTVGAFLFQECTASSQTKLREPLRDLNSTHAPAPSIRIRGFRAIDAPGGGRDPPRSASKQRRRENGPGKPDIDSTDSIRLALHKEEHFPQCLRGLRKRGRVTGLRGKSLFLTYSAETEKRFPAGAADALGGPGLVAA